MEQELGLKLEKEIGLTTYVSLLPRDLKILLYKYLFLKSGFDIKIISDDKIGNVGRTYRREVILVISNIYITQNYAFNIDYMKKMSYKYKIKDFINHILGKEGYSNIYITEVSAFDTLESNGKLVYFTIDPRITKRDPNKKLITQLIFPITVDILEALLTIGAMEGV